MPPIPPSIERIIDFARREINPSKVILFGSRARGTNSPTADFDLAFFCRDCSHGEWARFTTEIDERPFTLFPVDLVDYHKASAELRSRIDREGIIIYEQS